MTNYKGFAIINYIMNRNGENVMDDVRLIEIYKITRSLCYEKNIEDRTIAGV